MTCTNFLQKSRFGCAYIGQGLPRLGLREENDEIHRVAFPERDANLGFALKSADAAAMSGARIDDDPGAGFVARRCCPFHRMNAHERVVDRAVELAAVDDDVVLKSEYWPKTFFLAHDASIAALAQRREKEKPALSEVFGVF